MRGRVNILEHVPLRDLERMFFSHNHHFLMGCEAEGFEGKQWNYNNPLNWFLTPNFIFASESRAISDYAS